MKKVIVQPERCVGCRQCMAACATVHSRSGSLLGAATESPLPRPRVHVGVGRFEEGFPNRCRHCDPAPCLIACLPGAIFRVDEIDTVLIDPERCINCASCAMACPFGVIRYHEEPLGLPGKAVAVKCDNCQSRLRQGLAPACTEVCKSGALVFDEPDRVLRRRTDAVSRSVSSGADERETAPGYALLMAARRAQLATRAA
jgi:carbon-monoxide dehydrogenase iron sulfur subunit